MLRTLVAVALGTGLLGAEGPSKPGPGPLLPSTQIVIEGGPHTIEIAVRPNCFQCGFTV